MEFNDTDNYTGTVLVAGMGAHAMFQTGRKEMEYKKLMGIILAVSVITFVACSGVAQRPVETANQGGSPLTVKGKIDYMKNLGGYFILGDVPAREYFIENQDPKLLEALYKSGKIVTIEGRIVRGAEYLYIDKIDGKPYRGK